MAKVFAKNLFDKHIMGIDGTEIGTLYNVIVDLRMGTLLDLVIRPDIVLNTDEFKVEDGFIRLPFASVRAIKDYIVVDRKAPTRF